MGATAKQCVCESNENNQMVCGTSCVNAGMVCKTVEECNRTGPIRATKKTMKRNKKQQLGGKSHKFSYNKMSNLISRNKAVEIGRLYGKPDIIDNAFVVVDFASKKRAMLELNMFADGSWYQESLCAIGHTAKIECKIPGPTRFWPKESLGNPPLPKIILSPRNPKGPIMLDVPVDSKLLKAGDHIVSSNSLYGGSYNMLKSMLPRFGITTTFIDPNDIANFESAVKRLRTWTIALFVAFKVFGSIPGFLVESALTSPLKITDNKFC